jgi:CspA family cold shock protein
MDGKIKWYRREKGYGFITGNDNKDYFVHYTALPEGQEDIKEEDEIKVSFEIKTTDRGTQAIDIKLAEKESSDEEE